jgi:hypothetical protein
MAQRIEVQYTDDIDGTPADTTVKFGVDGTSYEIDLSAAHAEEFRDSLRPFIETARKASGAGRQAGRAARAAVNPAVVREWARRQGIRVSARGRLPDELVDMFRAADS